ncbi:hypothetical protein QL285_052498 [Trifolium repens]|nr:hypothetical protein QL285_052498 [Trifolium repens]
MRQKQNDATSKENMLGCGSVESMNRYGTDLVGEGRGSVSECFLNIAFKLPGADMTFEVLFVFDYIDFEGSWKLNNQNLRGLCNEAQQLKGNFKSVTVEHVPRGYNAEADAQASRGKNLGGMTSRLF